MLLEDSVILVKLNQQNNVCILLLFIGAPDTLLWCLQNGETALFWAASYGNVEIVTQLLIAGGNPYIKNRVSFDILAATFF